MNRELTADEICDGRTPEDFGKVVVLIEGKTRSAFCRAIDEYALGEADCAALAYFGMLALIATYLQATSDGEARLQFMADIAHLSDTIPYDHTDHGPASH